MVLQRGSLPSPAWSIPTFLFSGWSWNQFDPRPLKAPPRPVQCRFTGLEGIFRMNWRRQSDFINSRWRFVKTPSLSLAQLPGITILSQTSCTSLTPEDPEFSSPEFSSIRCKALCFLLQWHKHRLP